jgi:hypothetical protein
MSALTRRAACVLLTTAVFVVAADSEHRAAAPQAHGSAGSCESRTALTRRRDVPQEMKGLLEDGRRVVGDDDLWTLARVNVGAEWRAKHPWFRLTDGAPVVRAQLVGDPSRRSFRAHVPRAESYPVGLNPFGFMPSSLAFPARGCWRIAATMGGAKVVLHAYVDDPGVSGSASVSAGGPTAPMARR